MKSIIDKIIDHLTVSLPNLPRRDTVSHSFKEHHPLYKTPNLLRRKAIASTVILAEKTCFSMFSK